jgi:hypothetical protein
MTSHTLNILKFYISFLSKMNESDRFCPIVGKISLDPGESLPIDSAEKHRCLICHHYQENTNLLEQNSRSLRLKLYTFYRYKIVEGEVNNNDTIKFDFRKLFCYSEFFDIQHNQYI